MMGKKLGIFQWRNRKTTSQHNYNARKTLFDPISGAEMF